MGGRVTEGYISQAVDHSHGRGAGEGADSGLSAQSGVRGSQGHKVNIHVLKVPEINIQWSELLSFLSFSVIL